MNLNIRQLVAVAEKLGELLDTVVFIGGSTTSLLVDDAGTTNIRYTDDVDFIVKVVHSYVEHTKFEEKLRTLGFSHDINGHTCRWTIPFLSGVLKVDAMPLSGDVLGFTNIWYKSAVDSSEKHRLTDEIEINVVGPCEFLATKFEAFISRGEGNYGSRDIEDIIYVLEHRTGIELLIFDASQDLKAYLKNQAVVLLGDDRFLNYLPGLVDDPLSVHEILIKLKFVSEKC